MDIIDKINENHVEQIVNLEKKIFPGSFYKKEQLEEMKLSNDYLFLIAEENLEVVGYIIAHDSLDIFEIMKIAVVENKRGRSVAEELLKKLLEITKLNVILEVRESNMRAIRFYGKMGMKKISLRKGYYSDNGENAAIMLLEREE
ncbi:MAG: ribosomal protein S18-alanine N-acetyltransferase [Fusobacteriaceae bacterium]